MAITRSTEVVALIGYLDPTSEEHRCNLVVTGELLGFGHQVEALFAESFFATLDPPYAYKHTVSLDIWDDDVMVGRGRTWREAAEDLAGAVMGRSMLVSPQGEVEPSPALRAPIALGPGEALP